MNNADATEGRSKRALKAFTVHGFRNGCGDVESTRKTAVDISLRALERLQADSHDTVRDPVTRTPHDQHLAPIHIRTIQRYPSSSPPPAHYPANRLNGLPTTGVPALDTPFTDPPFTLSDFCSAAGSALRSCWTDAIGNLLLRVGD